MSSWLTAAEVETFTHRSRWKAQARALDRSGVPYQLSAQGRPLVERSVVFKGEKAPRKAAGPDWSRMKAS